MHGRLPRGTAWSVRRRWLPWRRRAQEIDWFSEANASSAFDGVDDLGGLLLAIVLIPVFLIVAPAILLALFIGLEFLLLLLLLPIWVFVRAAFGTPWIVVARIDRQIVTEVAVRGWAESGRAITAIADDIRAGRLSRRVGP